MTRSKCKFYSFYNSLYNESVKQNFDPSIKLYRGSKILSNFLGKDLKVYNGKKYFSIIISSSMIGMNLGEFVHGRKLGLIHTKKKSMQKQKK